MPRDTSSPVEHIGRAFPDAALCGWKEPGWYFWDESWANCYGPYITRGEAEDAANHYAAQLENSS